MPYKTWGNRANLKVTSRVAIDQYPSAVHLARQLAVLLADSAQFEHEPHKKSTVTYSLSWNTHPALCLVAIDVTGHEVTPVPVAKAILGCLGGQGVQHVNVYLKLSVHVMAVHSHRRVKSEEMLASTNS